MSTKGEMHVAIVGAGVAGLSLAFALAARSRVTVLEAGSVGERGASSLPAALLNPYRGRTARAHPEDLAGLEAFWHRDDDLRAAGHETGSIRAGVLRIASNERQAKAWRSSSAPDQDVAWLEPEEVAAPYHGPHGGLRVDSGGWVRPRYLLAALAAGSRALGARIGEHARVERVERAGAAWAVSTAAATYQASHVVLCTGAEPLPVAWSHGVELERVAGDVVGLAPSESFPTPVAGAVYGAHLGGQTWIGGNHRHPDARDPAAPAALRRSFSWFVPPLRAAPIDSVWTGVRAKQPGNRPLVREISQNIWVFGALAGRGFLCGAAEAEALAARLTA